MSNLTPNGAIDLATIATDIIIKELKRRAVAKGMTTEELLKEAQSEWDQAEVDAEHLRNEP